MIIMKTRRQLLSRLQSRVHELHSYEVPEIIAVELADGSAPYVDWVIESTSSPQGEGSE
jgi:periplasmic divalent cation tolerance protein